MKSAQYLFGLTAVALAVSAHAAPFAEGFDNVGALAGAGWIMTNASAAPDQAWQQGNSGVFTSQSGAADSYVEADFLSSSSGAISNWLISPVLTLDAGSVLSFYARSAGTPGFGDFLEVLFSTGSGSALGSFSSLGTIGTAGAAGFPTAWTKFTFALPSAATGRFAFRQGGTFDTADYIGIDTVSVAAAVPEPSTYALMALGIAGLALVRRSRRAA